MAQAQVSVGVGVRTNIAVGLGTKAGLVGGAAGLAIPFVGELAGAAEPLGVPPQVWVITGAVLTGLVILGRMGQAIAALWAVAPGRSRNLER